MPIYGKLRIWIRRISGKLEIRRGTVKKKRKLSEMKKKDPAGLRNLLKSLKLQSHSSRGYKWSE